MHPLMRPVVPSGLFETVSGVGESDAVPTFLHVTSSSTWSCELTDDVTSASWWMSDRSLGPGQGQGSDRHSEHSLTYYAYYAPFVPLMGVLSL